MTRVLAFSDTLRRSDLATAILDASTTANLVIGAGDFCNMRHGLAEVLHWLGPVAHKAVNVGQIRKRGLIGRTEVVNLGPRAGMFDL